MDARLRGYDDPPLCHSRAGGSPSEPRWMPVFTGMTSYYIDARLRGYHNHQMDTRLRGYDKTGRWMPVFTGMKD
jgi:hypothetical protein